VSAICGILRDPGKTVPPSALRDMTGAMTGWGCGEATQDVRDCAGLAHVPSALESSRGSLVRAADNTVLAAVDGRIDGRTELCRMLGLAPADAFALSAAELVVQAYLRFGERCAQHLVGAFAFLIWDASRGILVCARDHIGFRPLHYHDGPHGLAVATDAEGVLAAPGVDREIDVEAVLAREMMCKPPLRGQSVYKGVWKVLPGTVLVAEPGGRRSRFTHWAPRSGRRLRLRGKGEYAELLRETLRVVIEDAVRDQASIGAHLSGGLDSCSVAALAQEALAADGRSLSRCFSWSPPEPSESGEHARIAAVADRIGVEVEWTSIGAAEIAAGQLRSVEHGPGDALYESSVLARSGALGVEVLLSGWGGDECASFNGRGQLAWLLRTGRWRLLLREAAARAEDSSVPARLKSAGYGVWNGAVRPLVPRRIRARSRGVPRKLRRQRDAAWRAVHPDAVRLKRKSWARSATATSAGATQARLLTGGHLEHRIEAWAQAAAPVGVEYRYPLLDRRVIDLCLTFPGEAWLQGGVSRHVFRAAVAPFLPPELVWGSPKEEPVRVRRYLELAASAEIPDIADPIAAHGARARRQFARWLLDGQGPG
jgi:asparagine synthase (glutamine-hydrolysing)